MKTCSTTMKYYYTPIRMPKSKMLTTSNAGKDVKQQELSFLTGGNAKWCSQFGKQFGTSYKTKHTLTI